MCGPKLSRRFLDMKNWKSLSLTKYEDLSRIKANDTGQVWEAGSVCKAACVAWASEERRGAYNAFMDADNRHVDLNYSRDGGPGRQNTQTRSRLLLNEINYLNFLHDGGNTIETTFGKLKLCCTIFLAYCAR